MAILQCLDLMPNVREVLAGLKKASHMIRFVPASGGEVRGLPGGCCGLPCSPYHMIPDPPPSLSEKSHLICHCHWGSHPSLKQVDSDMDCLVTEC